MNLSVENALDKNPSTLYSFLSTNLATGGTVVPLKNINAFTNQWSIQLGRTGEETAEILTISGVPSGTAVNTSGTVRFAHPLDTPVYNVHYDSVIFSRSVTGTSGTASILATVSITPDSFYTEYNDSSGAATYAYQTQFYNTVSGDISGTSSWFVPGGPTAYSLQRMRARVKHDLYSASYIRDDTTIDDWINEWLEVMTNSVIKINQGYAIGTANYAFALSGTPSMALGTVTDILFRNPNKLEVTFNGVSFVNSTEIALNNFSSTDIFSSNSPRHYWMGDTVFGILPATAGTVRMTNSLRYTPLANDADELPQVMKGYTPSFIEYCLYKAYSLDQKDGPAESHWTKALTYQNAFISEITPRDKTGIKMISMDEGLSGLSEDVALSGELYF